MMRTERELLIDSQKFKMLGDPELPRQLSGATVRDCWFFACDYGMTAKVPSERRWIRDVQIVRSKATNNSSLGPIVVEDVDVDGLLTGGVCIAWGAAFRHVRIRGRCGKFMLSFIPPTSRSVDEIRQFELDNQRIYEGTDWALDISEGEFEELDIRNVPADLVRRDPETQIVVRRGRVEAMQQVWRKLDLSGTPWETSLTNMLAWGMADKVLVAPKRRSDFQLWLSGLRLLQKEGVAESD
jgi:hypothetical protein